MRDIQRVTVSVLIGSWLLLPAGALTGNTGSLEQGCVPAPAGLVGWWPGDGHTSDLSGSGLDGVVVGSGVTYAPGLVGPAFQFNNENGRVLVPYSPDLDSALALTIEAWVQPWSPPLENVGLVVDHAGAFGTTTVGGGYALTMQTFVNGTAAAGVHLSNVPGSLNWDSLYSPALAVNAWYHLVGAYDAAALRYRFYVNGVDIYGTGRDPVAPNPINYYQQLDLSIGNALGVIGGIDRGFYGLIDEVRVFNRELSAAEIGSIFAAGSAGVCKVTTVCHKPSTGAGKTLKIPTQALSGHLGHGDTMGACSASLP
jgi:hypothetical protein